ncbi:aspartic peptidase domain-containing protein [Podospora didyma]|uniref:Aspartic peptidase domain-containing protein n=1 Tax=Podospora didyma TaxID=330526 RepID=A0AAE0NNM6_9PEZI|nr:aspartic peptidase domain-containing protein [Podospora didyma]
MKLLSFGLRASLCFATALVQSDATSSGVETAGKNTQPLNLDLMSWRKGKTDLQWYATIAVGTPPQKFTVILDTGSSALLLPRRNCSTCKGHNLFDPSQSKTFSAQPGYRLEPAFGTGGDTIPLSNPQVARCTVASDTVSIAGLVSPNHQFLLCDEYEDALAGQPVDGILGLSPASTSSWDGQNSFETLYRHLINSNQLSRPEFAISYVPGKTRGSQITLGGSDPLKYRGDVITIPMNKQLSKLREGWVLDVQSVYVGSKLLKNSTSYRPAVPAVTLLDTGTAYMLVPDVETARDLYGQVSMEIKPIDSLGSWGAPCKMMERVAKDITFTVGNGAHLANLTVPRRAFSLGEYPGKPGICQGLYLSPPSPAREPLEGRPAWVFGSPLLKSYYTVWNGVDMTMGFAKPSWGHCGRRS